MRLSNSDNRNKNSSEVSLFQNGHVKAAHCCKEPISSLRDAFCIDKQAVPGKLMIHCNIQALPSSTKTGMHMEDSHSMGLDKTVKNSPVDCNKKFHSIASTVVGYAARL